MKQSSIFDFMFEKKLIKKPIRIIELFGGYGSQYMALKYLGANAESYKLAGNSIVIQVLMGIFGELLGIDYKKKIKESVKEIV